MDTKKTAEEQQKDSRKTAEEQQKDTNNNINNENNGNNKNISEKKFSDDTIKFCNDAFDYLKKEHGNAFPKNPKIEDWYDCIDKLQRLDGFEFENIKTTLQWGVKDDFWSQQIISFASLRYKKRSDLTKFQKIYNAYKNERDSSKSLNSAEKRLNNNLQVGKEWLNEQ